MTKKMLIKGMMCVRCKAAVEKGLARIDGVEACTVDLDAGEATVTLSRDVPDAVLMDAVKQLDFTPVRML